MTDAKVLDAAMERVDGDRPATGGVKGTGPVFVVNNDADPSLIALRYRLKDAAFEVAEEPFEAAGRKFNRGSFIIRDARRPTCRPQAHASSASRPTPSGGADREDAPGEGAAHRATSTPGSARRTRAGGGWSSTA